MSLWALIGVGLVLVILPEPSKSSLVEIDSLALSALRDIIADNLDAWVEASFDATNGSLTFETARYGVCERKIKDRMEECGQCVKDRCLESFRQRCITAQQPEEPEPQPLIDQDKLMCIISPESCVAIKVGETAVKVLKSAVGKVADAVKKGFKKVGGIAKKIFKGITNPIKGLLGAFGRFRIRLPRIRLPRIRIRLPRIRLPRIRLPRIRLPRIRLPRIRLPRIRLPRIRLPRIRLPRIRLPRIRLPRIRLPRIRLPRIRLPRIRLPRVRFGRGWRRKRQATEPTCDDLMNDSGSACQFYQSACDSCGVYGQPSAVQSLDQLISTVCGPDFVETSTRVEILENRLQRLEDLYEIRNLQVFNVKSVKYDPDISEPDGHTGVQVSFLALGQIYNVTIPDPVPIFSQPTAGPVMAKWIFEELFEDL